MVGQAQDDGFVAKGVTSEISGIRQSAPGIYQGDKFQGGSGILSSVDGHVWARGNHPFPAPKVF